MIDYTQFEVEEKGYEIFKDNTGKIITIGLPKQKHLVKISKFQYQIEALQDSYNKIRNKKVSEKAFDEMEALSDKLNSVIYNLFLFLLNLNEEKTFTLSDIKNTPLNLIQQECEKYMQYVNDQLKN